MSTLIYLNGMAANADFDVEVHAADCKDAKEKIRTMRYDDAGPVPAMSPAKLWEEYNLDFMEDGGGWPVTVFPCTGLVKKTTTQTGA